MNSAPTAMPTDQMMPMAESSRMRPRLPAHSMPSAESTANRSAPPMGSAPSQKAMPSPPNEACVMPPARKTMRRHTTYVPTMPHAMPESTHAVRALSR